MEDDKIQKIFHDFDPELRSDFEFMNRLAHSIQAVEMVKEQTHELHRRNRIAVSVAAVAGFVVGFGFAVAMPWLLKNFGVHVPSLGTPTNLLTGYSELILWFGTATIATATAINVYRLTRAPFTLRR